MSSAKKIQGFNQDVLWLFRGFEKAAIYLSFNYNIIDLTPKAEELFEVLRKKVKRKPLSFLFTPFNLKISFPKNGKVLIVSANSKSTISNFHKAQKIGDLNWKIKPIIIPGIKTKSFIIYTENKTNMEYLSQVYKMVTGENKVGYGSLKNYTKDIKNCLENIITHLPGNVYWLDKNLVYWGCNDNAAKFFGLKSRKEIVGLTSEDIEERAPWFGEHTRLWQQENLEIIKTGQPKFNVESGPFMMPSGELVYYLTDRKPLFDDKNNVIGVVGISTDISDLKKIKKPEQEQNLAEKTTRFIKMLSSSIAHELRTPLAIISINTDLLSMSPSFVAAADKDKGAVEKSFNSLKHAVKLASHIIDNMLVMLKTLTSGIRLESNFQQSSIADDVKKNLETYPFLEYERTLIEIEFNRVKDFYYRGDSNLTQHILFNLVRNALQAIKNAGKGKVKIGLDVEKDYNLLRFIDTALGISEEALTNIFGQFVSDKQIGMGLGLAFCKEVMQLYGGSISCKSKVGEYTEFTLRFPKLKC